MGVEEVRWICTGIIPHSKFIYGLSKCRKVQGNETSTIKIFGKSGSIFYWLLKVDVPDSFKIYAVSYTHLTLPTNREV